MKIKLLIILLVGYVIPFCLITACSDEEPEIMMEDETMMDEDNTVMDDCGSFLCEENLLPIIFVHGLLGSGDTYVGQIQRFVANGYPNDLLKAYNWNSLNSGDAETLLDEYVDQVLSEVNRDQAILMGHSAGGGLGYNYLSNPERAEKVAKYVHIGSSANEGPAGPNKEIPTLNLWSDGDLIVAGADIPDAINRMIPDKDHYQIATSAESFSEMFSFIHDKDPMRLEPEPQNELEISGVVLTFGENEIEVGVQVDLYLLNRRGEREFDNPRTWITDDQGRWGPVTIGSDTNYEFVLSKSDPDFRTIHYYRSDFSADNPNVYLRSFPPPTSLAGLFLSSIPKDDNQSAVTIFSSSQAVINGRDKLDINGNELSTPSLASPSQTSIAFFIYDDGDKISSGDAIPGFATFPFLSGVDYFFGTEEETSITATFNNKSIMAKNWKSDSEGVIVFVFE